MSAAAPRRIERLAPASSPGQRAASTRAATLRQWVEALQEVMRTRSEPVQRKLLHDNAARFYGLK